MSLPAFRPAPLATLARWLFPALDGTGPVLGVPRANLAFPDARMEMRLLGGSVEAPLGVAAGPHTQLAQNLVSAWLCGARFMELKTVQARDDIEVARPCIDSADETYNCEWSQELALEQSFDEYLKAWVLVHVLARRMGRPGPGVIFDMSVGYDLEGIRGGKMQRFLARMRDAGAEVAAALEEVAKVEPRAREVEVPARISGAVTLSTMHGCPPAEIERIARYLLEELGVHTWVKLNPTLLGPDTLRGLLNARQGFDIEVPDAAFEHDPRFGDAVAMIRNLAAAAKSVAARPAGAPGRDVTFGIKLSNTLEVRNRGRVFPPSEPMMYLSGRALHPLTLTLAHRLTEELDGTVPISFCGGADADNFPDLVADGLGPVTVCTDLLKPGGYARLGQYLSNLGAAMETAAAKTLAEFTGTGARERLARHAAHVAGEPRYARRERPMATKRSRELGAFDCVAAPCMEACPAHQNVPDYMFLVARGRRAEALDVILRTNPLPTVTGSICDQPCIDACVRNHYDAPLAIREVKRFAAEAAPASTPAPGRDHEARVAVIGAGPAGLSAAFYLRLAGLRVTLFDAAPAPGGMVSGVVPEYRLPAASSQRDIERVKSLGAEVRTGVRLGSGANLDSLRREGFRNFVVGVGAQRGRRLGVPGDDAAGVTDALEFLRHARRGGAQDPGPRVLVVGGGNTAMDAARTARRLVEAGSVTLVYRRSRAAMPADPEEIHACDLEGVEIREWLAPVEVVLDSPVGIPAAGGPDATATETPRRAVGLRCRPMRPGATDSSGRARPVPTGEPDVVLPCELIIPAVGQDTALDFLDGEDVEIGRDGTLRVDPGTGETRVRGIFAGGDVVRGPASIIEAVADGRRAAAEIARRHGSALPSEVELEKFLGLPELMAKRAARAPAEPVPVLPVARRRGFDEVNLPFGADAAAREASRCLDCDEVCSLCVTVCPNRALQAFAMSPLRVEPGELAMRGGALVPADCAAFEARQRVQIAHVADFCNRCGNCTTFCPTRGEPWRAKPSFWLDVAGFECAGDDAYRAERSGEAVVLEAKIGGGRHRLAVSGNEAVYRGPKVRAFWRVEGWKLVSAEPVGILAEGERVDLLPCATLIALLPALEQLPGW
ncbi:MAG: putative selenate reductase subunit YgfK [Candidatus Eisenbacteria bacterium]|nr:putative selenate reductase subunit YgfK [Candidatus Eisenbacteria bacterium]